MNHKITNLALQLLLAAVTGAVAGLVIFTISHVAGRNLYIVLGAIAGVAATLALPRYRGVAQFTELTITVPQVSQLKFVVNNESRLVAWRLYIETVTRIATQPLSDDDGFLREALTSLYGLFTITRDILKASRPSIPAAGDQTVEHLAVTMLNRHLRPFLSKWHPRLREFEQAQPDGRESDWPGNNSCRNDLVQVQEHLVAYALAFARLAGVQDAREAIKAIDER
jgi:hypothetical protein